VQWLACDERDESQGRDGSQPGDVHVRWSLARGRNCWCGCTHAKLWSDFQGQDDSRIPCSSVSARRMMIKLKQFFHISTATSTVPDVRCSGGGLVPTAEPTLAIYTPDNYGSSYRCSCHNNKFLVGRLLASSPIPKVQTKPENITRRVDHAACCLLRCKVCFRSDSSRLYAL
jgi:hypothetical protein